MLLRCWWVTRSTKGDFVNYCPQKISILRYFYTSCKYVFIIFKFQCRIQELSWLWNWVCGYLHNKQPCDKPLCLPMESDAVVHHMLHPVLIQLLSFWGCLIYSETHCGLHMPGMPVPMISISPKRQKAGKPDFRWCENRNGDFLYNLNMGPASRSVPCIIIALKEKNKAPTIWLNCICLQPVCDFAV